MNDVVPNGNSGPIPTIDRLSVRDVEISSLELRVVEAAVKCSEIIRYLYLDGWDMFMDLDYALNALIDAKRGVPK